MNMQGLYEKEKLIYRPSRAHTHTEREEGEEEGRGRGRYSV